MTLLYRIIPGENDCPPYAYIDDVFSRDELDILQKKAMQATENASIGGEKNNEVNTHYRRTKIYWLSINPETGWVFEKIGDAVRNLNSRFYKFDIEGFGESIQLGNYTSSDEGLYNWHIDSGGLGHRLRKMSVVLQLSEPGEYEGGDLQILHDSDRPITVEKKRGRLIIFPSYTIHRVTPVIAGSRQSLVAWLFGYPLR